MKKIILPVFVFFLIISASFTGFAQETEKKEPEKTTTIDAWRQAMPQNEQPSYTLSPEEKKQETVKVEETPEQIGNRIYGLEGKFFEALKLRDSAELNRLIADDFMPVGINLSGQPDKTHYIDWAMKSLQLKSYTIDKKSIQVFPAATVVTTTYKRQAIIADAPADGDFAVTDVWIKRGKQWQIVSHHISQLQKP